MFPALFVSYGTEECKRGNSVLLLQRHDDALHEGLRS